MKNVLTCCSLMVLFIACGGKSDTGSEHGQEEKPPKAATKAPETKAPEKVARDAVAPSNCAANNLAVYIKDADDSGTNIRNKPGGDVVLTLDASEDYMLYVSAEKDGWFKVNNAVLTAKNEIAIPGKEGWIHGSVIAVGTSNYGNQHLPLLEHYENKKAVGVIKEESYDLRIKELCGEWVKVDFKGTVGWIEAKWLCGSPWTNCS